MPLHVRTYKFCVYMYVCVHSFILYIFACMCCYLAFSQPATVPSSICEGSNVTLQCRVVFNDNPRESVWYRNGATVRLGHDFFIPNHIVIFNSTIGVRTDLIVTNVILEDDNTVYTCNSSDDSITSSVVLNVIGKCMHCGYIMSDYLRHHSV